MSLETHDGYHQWLKPVSTCIYTLMRLIHAPVDGDDGLAMSETWWFLLPFEYAHRTEMILYGRGEPRTFLSIQLQQGRAE